ncbi:MAG: hypothetical protein ACYS0I_11905 [Planctomycetota bacterium]|jgi:hypothetical protein
MNKQKTGTQDILTTIKTDVNLSRLPLFALTRQGLKTNIVREWIFTETRENERVELIWRIMATPQYGYPSPFAKKVHRAVEYLLTINGLPAPEYLDFSLYEITNVLDLPDSGNMLNNVQNALKSITATTIESKGIYCYLENGQKRFINKLLHLYETVIFIGETLPDGTMADRNRIYFNEWYLKTLNSGYIKPLDFPYWNSLRSDIARRLYEYLSFVSFATKCKPFSIKYHRLCELLPITSQRYLSAAKRNLSPAHQELMNTGFLKKVVWRKSKTDPKTWIIVYHFGMRAKSELQRGFNDDTYRPAILAVETAEIEEIEELIEPEGEEHQVKPKRKRAPEKKDLSPIAQELIDRGITESVAIDFADSFPEEHIRDKIEMHDVNKATGMLTQNAAGWLREAITRDFKISEEQKQKLSRVEKIKAEEEVTSKLEEQAKEIQEQRLKEALVNFPTEEEWIKARIEEHIKVREEFRTFDPTRPSFTEEEIEEYRQEYKEKFPQTDEERRNWLITNDDRYNLKKITSELSEQQEEKEEKLQETADERFPLNSIEDVLGEVARQRAEFEAEQKESEEE